MKDAKSTLPLQVDSHPFTSSIFFHQTHGSNFASLSAVITGCFQQYDESDSLERNAHRKQAVLWYKEQSSNPLKQSTDVSSKEN